MTPRLLLAVAAATALTAPAAAHVTLERQEAAAGERYEAVLRVGHGCAGSPTVAIRVQIPEGILGAQPMPKPGWEVEIVREPLAESISDGHGGEISERVSEIHWTGGSLPDDVHDEFVFRTRLPETPGATVHFPVVRECEEGVHRWIEVPAEGQDADDLPEPAPALALTD